MDLRKFFTLLALLQCTLLSAQLELDNEPSTDPVVNNTHYEEVILQPGYDFTGEANYKMNAYIDPTQIAPSDYGNLFTTDEFENYGINNNLEVGFTPGMHDVSPSGAATYTVPIQLPPGTNGMEPELAISYNSQAGNGLLGMGWNLAGLSSISRVGKTIYHDGKSDKIRFDSSDRFALDGNRLVSTSANEFATEQETFSLITSHGSAGSGPAWFEVRTKDGMTLEYGKTDDSRFVVTDNGEALNWMLNKVYDQHGNYIEYIYIQENGQIRVDKIKYTGNEAANLEPYNEVQFSYQDRDDKSEGFLGGSHLLKSSYLMKSISVKSSAAQYRKYECTYGFDGLYSYLSEISEVGENYSSEMNKTIFRYPSNSPILPDILNVSISGLPNSYASSGSCSMNYMFNPRVHYYSGDFNGDGVSDLLAVSHYTSGGNEGRPNSWSIFINKTHVGEGWSCHELTLPNIFTHQSGLYPYTPSSHFAVAGFSFHVGDLNGNGIDDVVFGYKKATVNDRVFYKGYFSTITDDQIDLVPSSLELEFEDIEESPPFWEPWATPDYHRHIASLGDFDGDGILEFFGLDLRTLNYTITSFDGRVSFSHNENLNLNGIKEDSPYVGTSFDCNGDGRHSVFIYYQHQNQYKERIFHFNVNPGDQLQHGMTFQNNISYEAVQPWLFSNLTFHSDFNGDGISDRIQTDLVGYYIQYHKGWRRQTMDDDDNYATNFLFLKSSNDIMHVADVNGDGRSDIIVLSSQNTNSVANIYIMTGELGGYEHHAVDIGEGVNSASSFVFGDFNGDGVTNMGLCNSFISPELKIFDFNLESKPQNRRLSGIKNGFLQEATFVYQNLSKTVNSPLHGAPESYPLRKVYGGFPVVHWVTTENSLGQKVRETYQFNSGIAHLQGKGFLGFEKINSRIENPAPSDGPGGPGEPFLEQRQTFQEFKLNQEYYVMIPDSSKQYAGATAVEFGNLASETSRTYSFVDTDHDTFWVKHDETNSYNHVGNVQTIEKFTYNDEPDGDGNLIKEVVEVGENGNTETITTEYSNFFTLGSWHIASSLPQTVSTSTSRNNEVELAEITHLAYNPNGTLLSKNQNIGTDAWSYQEYEYNNNPFGLVEKITISGNQPTQGGVNSDGVITTNEQITPIITDQYTYTPNGRNVLTHTDRFGFETEYTYYNRWGTPKTVTNHLGQQTYMEYDGFGRLKKEVDHLGNVTTVERQFYDGFTDQFTDCQSASDVLYQKTITSSGSDAVRTSTEWFNKFGQVRLQDATARSGIVRTTTCYDKRGRSFKTTTPHFIGEADFKEVVTEYDKYDRIESRSSDPVQMDLDYEIVLTGGTESILTSNAMDTRRTETDATGRVVKRKDSGNANTLDYIYQSGGLLKTVKLNNSIVAENTYDAFGRQIALSDPMASGTTLYQYDAFDRLVFQKDNKGNKIETYFDDYGRIEKRDVTGITPSYEDDYIYEYYNSGHQNTLLKKETAPGDNATEYTYNENGSIISITETIDEVDYTTQWQFDEYEKPIRKEFPETGFAIRYHYDNGYLERITTDAGATIWEIGNDGVNARGQIMGYSLGNGVNVSHVYDDDFLPESVTAVNEEEELFTFSYYFKPESGNLRNRNLHGMTEWFEYDNGTSVKLHRLTGAGLDPDDMDVNYWYSSNGNMVSKSDVGQYTYDSDQEYQVSQIDFEGGVDPEDPLIDMVGHQAVVYNHFNSASLIHDLTSDRKVELFYGPDDQRRMAVYKEGDDEVKTRYYVGAYEKQIDDENNEIRVHYISALGQLVAIYVEDDSEQVTDEGLNGKMYYPHLDHLGSIIHISDASGDIVYTQSFDAWGRTRNPDDLSYNDIPERPDWLWRGYTGHEHLDEFGLINMNGRLYDPVVGRMLSPDNYIQSPNFSQSYNRYSYVWNNPLKYTDPTGEFVFIVPHIGVSSSGSLDIGVSVGVGFPSGLSAQVTVGHSFGNGGNTYATLSASVAGASAYVGYSSQGGAMAGVGFGIGPGLGGFTTNATSAGIHWSQKGGVTANASIFSYNQYGGFNAHLTAGYSQGFEVGVREEAIWGRDPLYGVTASNDPKYVAFGPVVTIVGYRNKPYIEVLGSGLNIAGADAGIMAHMMYNSETWYSAQAKRAYSQGYYGNQYRPANSVTLDKAKARGVSSVFKWGGRLLGAGSMAASTISYREGGMDDMMYGAEMTAGAASIIVPKLGGPAVAVGWEMGRLTTKIPAYQNWKRDAWLPFRNEQFGY